MNCFDLHMHSMYSQDGQFSCEELVNIAKEKGLHTISLTDHDSIEGIEQMMEYGKKEGIRVIPGIECSTLFEGNDVHLLGYGIDLRTPYFKEITEKLRKLSSDAFSTRVEKLRQKYNVEIDEEQVIRDSHGKNPWFLMMDQLFNDPRYQSIPDFQEYIPGGRRCDPAPVNFFWDKCQPGSDLFVYVANPEFVDSVKEIHKAGGLAILAHPFNTFYQREDLLEKAIEAGIDGIEVYSNYHEPKHIEYYHQFALDHDLLISCGSDFHGEKKPSIQMGAYGLEVDGSSYLEAFLKKLGE